MKRNVIKGLAASAVFALGIAGAHAVEDSTTLDIKLTILGGCTVDFDGQQTNINLGGFSALDTAVTHEGVVNVRCNAGSEEEVGKEYSVSLDNGVHSQGIQRRLGRYDTTTEAFAEFITYNIYQGKLNTRKVWRSGDDALKGTIQAVQFTAQHPYVIEVPIQATPARGTYTDVLRATVVY